MMRSEKIATDVNDAHEELSGPASPVPGLGSLLRRLDRKKDELPGLLDEAIERLEAGLDALSDAQMSLQGALRTLEFDPRALEKCEERLFALRAAGRKYNVPVDALADLTAKMVGDLAELDAGEERLGHLEAEVVARAETFDRLAADLSVKRHETKRHLEAAVMGELPDMKLERAAFIVEIATDPNARSSAGIDTAEFWVRTNPARARGR